MTKSKLRNEMHSALIDQLGGTGAVARIFDVSDPTVSIWRKTQIPRARMMYIELAYPDAVASVAVKSKNETTTNLKCSE